jgi:putative intracellular protease/amidase
MAEHNLQGTRVAILATDGFEQVELEAPRNALVSAGANHGDCPEGRDNIRNEASRQSWHSQR